MLLIAGIFLQLQSAQAVQWKVVEKANFVWRSKAPYTLTIDEPLHASNNAEESQRLRIQVPDGREYLRRRWPGPFVTLKEGQVDSVLVADNVAQSPYVYLSPKLRGVGGAPMLILFGQAYASNPGSVRILALDRAGFPFEVFALDEFELTALIDLDGDGVAEIIGRPTLSQCDRCDHCSYDPFAVYRLPQPVTGKAKYRIDLSRRYNGDHYVWAGPKMSERIAVDVCRHDKPRLVSPR